MKTPLDTLAELVVKEGVGVGRLTHAQRTLALGLAWCSLPAGMVLREAHVNVALQRALAGPCGFLGIDHVELRRWLVDCGWMQRDGFGREYRRIDAAMLRPPLQSTAAMLESMDTGAWVAELRGATAARRDKRRHDWESRSVETSR
jgi:Uncharacterized protein conserved in bacteria (DUF2087)